MGRCCDEEVGEEAGSFGLGGRLVGGGESEDALLMLLFGGEPLGEAAEVVGAGIRRRARRSCSGGRMSSREGGIGG